MKLQLQYPIKPIFITQKFGETANLQWYKDHGVNFIGHNGIDFYAYHGQPIYAAHDGIAFYEIDADQGHGVVLQTTSTFDYGEQQVFFKTIYWHMVDSSKEPQFKSPVEAYTVNTGGLPIKQGDLLGYANTTGLSTGDHLHFGLKPCLPGEPPSQLVNIAQNNGYQGAIDPTPYFARHIFNVDMNYGDNNEEVKAMQDYLIMNGFMAPVSSAEYGQYGPRTRAAVRAFQNQYQVASFWILLSNQGKYVGPMTRLVMNVV